MQECPTREHRDVHNKSSILAALDQAINRLIILAGGVEVVRRGMSDRIMRAAHGEDVDPLRHIIGIAVNCPRVGKRMDYTGFALSTASHRVEEKREARNGRQQQHDAQAVISQFPSGAEVGRTHQHRVGDCQYVDKCPIVVSLTQPSQSSEE